MGKLIRCQARWWWLSVALVLGACVVGEGGPNQNQPEASDYDDIDEATPIAGGLLATLPTVFNRNVVVYDPLLVKPTVAAAQLQAFFERGLYGHTWIADEVIDDRPVAEAIVAVARQHKINPFALVVRMQVEKGLVSKAPTSAEAKDFAMGCGCHDDQPCDEARRGLAKQLGCAASTLREHYDASVAGTGQWRKGEARTSLDNLEVVPGNHATASLYAYTPWVENGGNKLVWTVSRRFAKAFDELEK